MLFFTLIGFCFFFLVAPVGASVAKVSISMDEPTSKVADMECGKETTVEFSGNIIGKSLGTDTIIIHLETVGPIPENVEVDFIPSVFTLEGLSTQTAAFSVTVTLKHDIEGDVPISIGIRGKWQVEGSPSVFTTNTEHIEVKPTSYFGISMSAANPFISDIVDTPLAFPITVSSNSNTDITYSVRLKDFSKNAFGLKTSVNCTAVPKGLIVIEDMVQRLEPFSTGIINVLLDGSKLPGEWGVVEITVDMTIESADVVEEISFHAQSVSNNLTLFIPDKSFLIALPLHQVTATKIEDIVLPDRLYYEDHRSIRYFPDLPRDKVSYRLTVGVLLIGKPNDVALEVEELQGYVVSWEPLSIQLGHLEIGIFNITIKRESGHEDDDASDKNIIRIRPLAPNSYSTHVYALVPQLNGKSYGGISTAEIAVIGGGILFLTGLGLGKMEFTRHGLLALFFFPLYSFIHEENALDHFTRGRIYQCVKDNPGTYYSRIKKELGLNNGVLSYHLQTLTRVELIKSKRHGTRKLFFITGTPIPEEITSKLNFMETAIRQMVFERPGITRKEIGEKFPEKSRRTIAHYVKKLSRKDYIYLVKEGRQSKCYPKEA